MVTGVGTTGNGKNDGIICYVKKSGSVDTKPAVHCVWDDWVLGECSATCGAGTRTNTRVKLVEEANGGTCDGQPNEIEECQAGECPIHCEWDEWVVEECSKSCGGGMQTQTR